MHHLRLTRKCYSQTAIDTRLRIIDGFATRTGRPREEAEQVWLELVKFLTLAARRPCAPSAVVDEMWHEFLEDSTYDRCCVELVGAVVHHIPSEEPEEALYSATLLAMRQWWGVLDERYWPSLMAAGCKGWNCRSCKSAPAL
jgi:hypothetical protein